MTAPRLEVTGLGKTFRNMRVLDDVRLTVWPGEIHGLAGQNGSGKSTLVKILTGYHPPDPGAHCRVDGAEMRLPLHWREIHRAGVSVVHQDLGLLDQLSVAENICVGGFPTTAGGRISRSERDRLTAGTLDRLGVALDPHRLVRSLSAAQRAEVAIARAIRDQPPQGGLVILDESTRALGGDDLRRVHALLRRIAGGGGAVLFISHNLTELAELTDRVTVLRDGRIAGDGLPATGLTEQEIARRMLGEEPAAAAARASQAVTERRPGATITGLTGPRIGPIDLDIAAGEVVGLTGLPGSGYEDVPYLITGAARPTGGTLRLGGRSVDLRRASTATCIRAGVVLVPERRDRDGLALEQNVRDNISLPALRRRGRPWFVARRWQQRDADAAVGTLAIRPGNTSLLVRQLSGGNQQKVLLAKWLNLKPALLVLHEPTQAVDVGARRDILAALHRAADSGAAILLVSSEPEDLAAACDRILIHRPGSGLHEVGETSPHALIDQIYDGEESKA